MKKIISIILLITWMIVIFMFSNANSTESSKTSSRVIGTFIEIKDNITQKNTPEINKAILTANLSYIVRKLAHITEYIILAILMYNVLYNYNIKDIKLVLILCIIYACTDEVHQIFIPGRSGQITDVLIDTFGSLLGAISYYLVRIF